METIAYTAAFCIITTLVIFAYKYLNEYFKWKSNKNFKKISSVIIAERDLGGIIYTLGIVKKNFEGRVIKKHIIVSGYFPERFVLQCKEDCDKVIEEYKEFNKVADIYNDVIRGRLQSRGTAYISFSK